MPLKIKTSKY